MTYICMQLQLRRNLVANLAGSVATQIDITVLLNWHEKLSWNKLFFLIIEMKQDSYKPKDSNSTKTATPN